MSERQDRCVDGALVDLSDFALSGRVQPLLPFNCTPVKRGANAIIRNALTSVLQLFSYSDEGSRGFDAEQVPISHGILPLHGGIHGGNQVAQQVRSQRGHGLSDRRFWKRVLHDAFASPPGHGHGQKEHPLKESVEHALRLPPDCRRDEPCECRDAGSERTGR